MLLLIWSSEQPLTTPNTVPEITAILPPSPTKRKLGPASAGFWIVIVSPTVNDKAVITDMIRFFKIVTSS